MLALRLNPKKKLCLAIALILSCFASIGHSDEAKKVNPNFNYILNGQVVNGWGMQLSDPQNWSLAMKDRSGKSASEKLSVEPSDFQGTGDAIKFTWAPRKQVKATVALYGSTIDLSSFENDGALVLDLKVDVSPDKDVTLGMDCGYPCRAELHVRQNLADLKKGQWSSLPIALNCFSKAGLDLKKVNGPILIATEGKLTVHITNVRLQKLVEGDKGCAK